MENGTMKNRYVYGVLNRLEQAVNAKGETVLYTYNGLGHRVGKTTGAIHPGKKIQYTIDLTKSYHNLLQKEEVGNTQSEMTVLFPKIIKILAYAGAFIDAGISINENIEKGSSWQKTSSDAFIELVISAGSIYASGEVGIIVGAEVGKVVDPGIGTIVGAIAGLIFGIFLYIVTDQIEWEGKSMRDHIKDYISDYYGWD